jgi:hypothetical protein
MRRTPVRAERPDTIAVFAIRPTRTDIGRYGGSFPPRDNRGVRGVVPPGDNYYRRATPSARAWAATAAVTAGATRSSNWLGIT